MTSTGSAPLSRRLGLPDAIVIGLSSMIGAGVFSAFAPATAAAGSALLIGLALAAVVAYCNAMSSAQLAAQYPVAGGTHVYGRERLGEWPGFIAGWSFLVGKTASCSAMAITFAAYVAPAAWHKPVAILAILGLTAINSRGITRTAFLARVLICIVLVVLGVVITAGVTAASPHPIAVANGLFDAGWRGILQSSALLFFAFAGYARIATLGEEVRSPERTIPRAIGIALGLALLIYALVAVALIVSLGTTRLAVASEPLLDVVSERSWEWALPLVRIGASAAALGALLALIAGVGRTSLAMARNGDLPRWFAAVHPRFQVPHRAEWAVALVSVALVALLDLRGAIGFSSFGVLVYYLVANLSAIRQETLFRRRARVVQIVGSVGCVALAIALPATSIIGGLVVIALGIAYRAVRMRVRR